MFVKSTGPAAQLADTPSPPQNFWKSTLLIDVATAGSILPIWTAPDHFSTLMDLQEMAFISLNTRVIGNWEENFSSLFGQR